MLYRRGKAADHHARAFSLVELLTVIAIIVILMSILLPSLRQMQILAWRSTCLNNVREIAKACSAYANADNMNRGRTPDALPSAGPTTGTENPESLFLVIKYEFASRGIFLCPHARTRQGLAEPGADDTEFTSGTYSYSYMSQVTTGDGYTETLVSDNDLGNPAIVADKNPRYTFGSTRSGEDGKNSMNHDRDGQNVALVDGSGTWLIDTKLDGDDIYQSEGGAGGARNTLSDSFVCP